MKTLSAYKIKAWGISDIGLVRPNNEDAWGYLEDASLFVIADGMGGHKAGEVASHIAVSTFLEKFKKRVSKEVREQAFKEMIQEVNVAVFEKGNTLDELKGMGTTLCVAFFYRDQVIIAHVGDSRIYRFRNHTLAPVTEDHSLLRMLVKRGSLLEQNASDFIHKNIITKAIGVEKSVEATIQTLSVEVGDYWILCTDGLSDLVSLKEMEEILNTSTAVKEASEQLVQAAKSKGGTDNITVVVTQIEKLS